MQRIIETTVADLFDVASTRRIEATAARALPPHALMRRAGLAVARLTMALAPHAHRIWIACGPGNNGGDGFEAAAQLRKRGFAPTVTFAGDEARLPGDARDALSRARAAGVTFADEPPPDPDFAIDALLGIGGARPPEGRMADWIARMQTGPAPLLCVDLPSGLGADTGTLAPGLVRTHPAGRRYCLSLLTLKPGTFTGHGRDAAGEIWFDDLGCASGGEKPAARLAGAAPLPARPHASHKGSWGDVAVVGGAPGMGGAALLAAMAALHGGAGRVFVAPLDAAAALLDGQEPALMWRRPETLAFDTMTVVCGCGGGGAVRAHLPRVLASAARAVLDADALNAIAVDESLQRQLRARAAHSRPTVLTPHPLEAARLLGTSAAAVQTDRLAAATALTRKFAAIVVLKGSGSVIAAEGRTPIINPTGNARLATAGTGDVLAGLIGAHLAAGCDAFEAARAAVWRHGALADRWPESPALTASALARAQ